MPTTQPLADLFFAPRTLQPAALLRPIRREDAAALGRFIQALSCEARRQRFHAQLRNCSAAMLEMLSDVDGERHVAFVAALPAGDGSDCIVAEARYIVDARGASAEFALVVADDWQGLGVADALMDALIAHARSRGLRSLYGQVRAGNGRMLGFMRRRGFVVAEAAYACEREAGTMRVEQVIEPLPQHRAGRLTAVLRRWLQEHFMLPVGRLRT